MIGKTVSQYRIEEQLGEGGMGIVYRAVDTKLDRDVALKFLPPRLSTDPEAKARFVQEAKAASGLDHPNICTIYEIGETDDGSLFIAMAFYDGQTLKYELQRGAMEPERAASIGAQIADGLRKAHAAKMVHRDIKPANIMLMSDGRVKILDFGVAKLAGGADLTKEGSTVGTTAYMSPEQARGEAVDARADLWSLGVLLYEMLSGEKPFGGEYEQAVFYSVLNENPKPLPSSVPDALSDVVGKLLAKSSADRYASADDVLRALEPWADSRVRDAVSSVPNKALQLVPDRWAAVAAGILLIAVAVWYFTPSSRDVTAPASDNLDHLVVLPFTIQGDESLAYLGDGMVTLLSGMLDGAGPIRSVDVNQILGFIKRNPDAVIDPEGGRVIASQLGANRYVLGTVVQAGPQRRLEARLYDGNGASLSSAQSVFTTEDTFMPAVDALARQIIGSELEKSNAQLSTLAAETTTSVSGLKNYLLALDALHSGQFGLAVDLSRAAIAEDSTFALAWYTLSEAYSWIPDFQAENEAMDQAYKYADRLEGSARLLIDGFYAYRKGDPHKAEGIFRRMVREYPNDTRAIGGLAETLTHYPMWFLATSDPLEEASTLFQHVLDIDPTNNLYQYHLAHYAIERGGAEAVIDLLDHVEGDKSFYSEIPDFLNRDETDATSFLSQQSDLSAVFAFSEYAVSDDNFPVAAQLIDYLDARAYDFSKESGESFLWVPMARAGAGRLHARDEYFEANRTPELSAHELAMRVFQAVLPGFECCSEDLESLKRSVQSFDASGIDESATLYFTWHESARDYLLGLIAWKQGDDAALQQSVDRFDTVWSGEEPIGDSFGHELRGLVAWRSGDQQAALGHLADVWTPFYSEESTSTLASHFSAVWFSAELLTELGRYQDAEKYFDVLRGLGMGRQWRAPSLIREGELYELMGDLESAIERYERVAKVWREADPELRPIVDKALARRDELLLRLGREPGDLPAPTKN